jgi:rhodanese-related sulfurtransferase
VNHRGGRAPDAAGATPVTSRHRGDAILVDIRESEERRERGGIPGAVGAPGGMLECWADPTSPYHRSEFDPTRRIILHCASGGRSALADDTLQPMGYSKVAHLDGGSLLGRRRAAR